MLRLRVPAGGWSAPAARVAGAGGLLPGHPAAVPPGLPPIPGSSPLRRRGAGHPPGAAGHAKVQVRPGQPPPALSTTAGQTAAMASSPARRARASSPASPAMRPGTAATRARPAATSAVPGQPSPGRRFTAGGYPPAWSRVSQPAAGRSQLTSSPRRSAIRSRPSSSASSSPQSECSRGGPARPAAHQAPRPAHPGRHRPRAGAPVRVTTPAAMARARIEIPSARAGASARARSRPGLLQPPGRRETRVRTRRSRRPASTRPLTSPAHRAGRVQETGRRGGADGPVVTGTLTLGPGWLCPQLPGGPGFRERQAGRRRRGRWR